MRVRIITFGCAHNRADSEAMRELLLAQGFEIGEPADVVIINTCGVKHSTEEKIMELIRRIKKPLVITGCLVEHEQRIRRVAAEAVLLHPDAQARVAEAVRLAAQGIAASLRWGEKFFYAAGGPILTIPVSEGCLGHCTYCFTRQARGRERSMPVEQVVQIIKEHPEALEVRITGEDVGAYGGGRGLPMLLEALAALETRAKIRLGMINPLFFVKYFDDIVETLRTPNFYKFLHVPIQSGSPEVLRRMGRAGSEAAFDLLKRAAEEFTLATDIIVGFPGESEEEFEASLHLIKRVRPDITNVSAFSPRPGTPAAGLKKLPTELVKARTRRLSEISRNISLEKNRQFIGRRVWAQITEKRRTALARTIEYKPVGIDGEIGERLYIKIKDATTRTLIGVRDNDTLG